LSLPAGTKLGPYEITSLLGAGGMGEVYRARDARLGREVALKILSEDFGRDPERVRRFEIEARSASGLSDAHVVTVFDVGEQAGVHYIATELVEGGDLRRMLDAGPLPTATALDLGVQIAEGLSAAHERGIVHRDLKPENILITTGGVAKIADFGLAKQTGASPEISQLVTAAEDSTGTGVVMGTVAYMSPEQARGSKVDLRSDQFSFGLLLYEMLTGRAAFRRENAADTLSAILRDEPPPLRDLARDVPEPFARLVHRCLSKDVVNRYGSTRDLFHDLKALREAPGPPPLPLAAVPRRGRPARMSAAALAVAAVAIAGFDLLRRPKPESGAI
jgi:serine/threonine protein kinase